VTPRLLEHLPGRHNQKTHGSWASKKRGGYAAAKHTSLQAWLGKGGVVGGYDPAGVGDRNLLNIWNEQGFAGPPRVVDDDALDAEVKAGGLELWRGIASRTDDGEDAERYAKQFIHGTQPHPGLGQYGNGTYATPNQEFASRYARSLTHTGGSMIRMVLRKDARVIAWEDLVTQLWGARDRVRDDARLEEAVRDIGRLASMLGYDALTVGTRGGREEPAEVVILNRTAVSVSPNVRTV
jgi:hypothetical protein